MTAKNPIAVKIGRRIVQAREMSDMDAPARLLSKVNGLLRKSTELWSRSRLSNYENGYSVPGPEEIMIIARATQASPCWLMFGLGPIRPGARDLQAVRNQNLHTLVAGLQEQKGKLTRFYTQTGLSAHKLKALETNPSASIDDRLARRIEKFQKKPKGWFDEQHVDQDLICAAFPPDMREVMEIYSSLAIAHRKVFVAMARGLTELA